MDSDFAALIFGPCHEETDSIAYTSTQSGQHLYYSAKYNRNA